MYYVMIATCIISSLSLFIHMRNSSILSQVSKRWFVFVFWGTMIGAASEALGDWMNISGAYRMAHMIVKCVEFSVTPWLPVCMALACEVEKRPSRIIALLLAHTILEWSLLPFHCIIDIDPSGFYHRGNLYIIYIAFYAVSFIYLLIAFHKISQRYKTKDQITMGMTVLVLLSALIPSLLDHKYRTAFLGITLTAIIFYEYYEGLVQQELSISLKNRNERISNMQQHTILGIADLIENRDSNTGTHIKNTSYYVEKLALAAKQAGVYSDELNDHFIELVVNAAPLHDVGKITIPDTILRKPGKLTDAEFEIMKTHAAEGGRIVRQILDGVTDDEYTNVAYDVATYHHEKWNGRGYPEGLSGQNIPLSARIMALADVYDALTMERVYKKAFPPEQALEIIKDGSGEQFDPFLADIFVKIARRQDAQYMENRA